MERTLVAAGDPDGEVRAHSFGRAGMVVYLILEQRRVELLGVLWVG